MRFFSVIGARIGAAFKRWQQRAVSRVQIEWVEERPERPRRGRLYVTGNPDRPGYGVLLCPCGCGDTLNLRFFGDRRPVWSLSGGGSAPTVKPSVWRTSGCRAHFFVRRGNVEWTR